MISSRLNTETDKKIDFLKLFHDCFKYQIFHQDV
jgi:hypothetical protein